MPYWVEIIINFTFAWISAVGFALIINVPHRALILCGFSGTAGWMVYWWGYQLGLGRLGSNLLGALLIGILGVVFARIKKCPVTVFNIPGIVPLVPGVPAYQAVRALVDGQLSDAEDLILRVAIVTIAIAMGFLLAQLVAEVFFNINIESNKIRFGIISIFETCRATILLIRKVVPSRYVERKQGPGLKPYFFKSVLSINS